MANEIKLFDPTTDKVGKNEIIVEVKTVIDEESYSNCRKKIEKLTEELKIVNSTIKDIDNAMKELKILLDYYALSNEEGSE